MHIITEFTFQEGYRLTLVFEDGARGVVDLSGLVGKGVFQAWDDMAYFQSARIGEFGELVWGEEIDLCPDALYLEATGKRPEDVFPALKRDGVHA